MEIRRGDSNLFDWNHPVNVVSGRNAHGMIYAAPMNENCFSRKGAKNIFFVYFVYFVV